MATYLNMLRNPGTLLDRAVQPPQQGLRGSFTRPAGGQGARYGSGAQQYGAGLFGGSGTGASGGASFGLGTNATTNLGAGGAMGTQSAGSPPVANGGAIDHAANFRKLMQEDPFLAKQYLEMSPEAQQWGLKNQFDIMRDYFGGADASGNSPVGYRNWVNDNSAGGGTWSARGGHALDVSNPEAYARLRALHGLPGTYGAVPAAGAGAGAGIGGAGTGAAGGAAAGIGTGAGAASGSGGGMQTGGGEPPIGGGAAGLAGGEDWGPQTSMDLDVDSFLDPSMNFRIQQGTNALESSAAARGGLLSGNTLRGVQDYAQNIAGQEYGNAVSRAMQDRGFRTGVDQNNRDFRYGALRDDRNFNFDRDRYNQEFGYRAQIGDRDFNYNRERDNRNFGYGAQRDDREYNYRTLSDLARLGFGGAQGAAGLQQTLATLLNSNILAGGNAGAGGAIGQGNAINDMITQLLRQLSQNQYRP